MVKKFTIHFEDFECVIESTAAFIKNEIMDVLNSRPDIFTEKYQKMFSIDILPSALMFTEDELLTRPMKTAEGKTAGWKDKAFSKEEIAKIYNSDKGDRHSTPAKAHMRWKNNDGILEISDMYIAINYDILKISVLRHLYDIIRYQDIVLRSWARHEAGHILDYIMLFDGKPVSVIKKDDKICNKAKKELNEFKKSVGYDTNKKALTREVDRQLEEMYFNMPQEARADTLGGVDRKKVIDYCFEYADKDMKVIATIKSKIVKREKKTADPS
jgi:hypothetical protein